MPNPIRNYAEEAAEKRRGYFVVSCSEDGDVLAELLDRDTILHRLDIEYWGERPIVQMERGQGILDVRSKAAVYIFKGESIAPKIKHVVTSWDVP